MKINARANGFTFNILSGWPCRFPLLFVWGIKTHTGCEPLCVKNLLSHVQERKGWKTPDFLTKIYYKYINSSQVIAVEVLHHSLLPYPRIWCPHLSVTKSCFIPMPLFKVFHSVMRDVFRKKRDYVGIFPILGGGGSDPFPLVYVCFTKFFFGMPKSSWGAKKHILLFWIFFVLGHLQKKNGISSKKFPYWGRGEGGSSHLGIFPT